MRFIILYQKQIYRQIKAENQTHIAIKYIYIYIYIYIYLYLYIYFMDLDIKIKDGIESFILAFLIKETHLLFPLSERQTRQVMYHVA